MTGAPQPPDASARQPGPLAPPADSGAPASPAPVSGAARRGPSPLSDGQWHRMHPLTPALRGGLMLLVLLGIVIANLRDRLAELVVPIFVPDADVTVPGPDEGDLFEFLVDRGLVGVAGLGVVVVLLVLVALFYLIWRFHTFRITEDDVEVKSGILFRTHRRAPLDRVQGVNLTRPMLARILGLAKLEVVGAGADGNVKLEYLSTRNAEAVRADILHLASGEQLGQESGPDEHGGAFTQTIASGVNEIIAGADAPDAEPESVVKIPVGRLIISQVLSDNTIGLVVLAIAIAIAASVGTAWVLLSLIPLVFVSVAVWVRGVTQSLRYSIAPTGSGLRVTFGLFTTITETLPPGRIHAVQVSQPLLWRPGGWWTITVNRLTGRSASSDPNGDRFAVVLPIGSRDDVQRVLKLMLPQVPPHAWPYIVGHGAFGPEADDPFTNSPRRAWWFRPFSWRRNGYLLLPDVLLIRRGRFSRKLAIFPLARMQSLGMSQGPIYRRLSLAKLRAHTVLGRVSGSLAAVDRDAAVSAFEAIAATAVAAAAGDRSHRWAGQSTPRYPEPTDHGSDSVPAAPSDGGEG